jgi:hypothetical protein
MKHVNKTGILLALILMVGMTLGATTGKRTVVMQIDLPNGSTPQLKVLEGDVATIGLKDGGKYGFVPSLAQDNESVVRVGVYDLTTTPHQQLSTVEVSVGGNSVKSDTTPAFSIRVLEVQAPQ